MAMKPGLCLKELLPSQQLGKGKHSDQFTDLFVTEKYGVVEKMKK
jgi:hypothetical protein